MTGPAIDAYGQAAAAYARATKQSGVASEQGSAPPGAGPASPSFTDWLEASAAAAVAEQKSTERVAQAAVSGGGDLTQVVTAVSEAELTLQTVVAVRDRVIEAYKDVMRMPI